MPFFGGSGGGASGGIGGSTGATDNAILRADGTGAATLQNSALNIDDGTTATQANVAITNQHSETNSALVLTPKGTGAFIAGPKPDGTTTGGNARGARAVDLQISKTNAAHVASGSDSVIGGGAKNTASGTGSFVGGGDNNTASGGATGYGAVAGGQNNQATGNGWAFVGGYSPPT